MHSKTWVLVLSVGSFVLGNILQNAADQKVIKALEDDIGKCDIVVMSPSTPEPVRDTVELRLILNCNGKMIALEGNVGQSVQGGPFFVDHNISTQIINPDIGSRTTYDLR